MLDYPRPAVAVDVAVLTFANGSHCVLLIQRSEGDKAGDWALPVRSFANASYLATPCFAASARRRGFRDAFPDSSTSWTTPQGTTGGLLSVAHVDVVPFADLQEALARDGVKLVSDSGEPGIVAQLPYGQTDIVAAATEWIRASYAEPPDPGALPEEPFTLRDLRSLHEAVARGVLDAIHVPAVHGTGACGNGKDVRRNAGTALAVVGSSACRGVGAMRSSGFLLGR